MTNPVFVRVAAAACVLSLSGCGLMGSLGLAHNGPKTAKQSEAGARMAQSATDEGREHLRANRPGKAIESFNLALFNGEEPAAAYNGLGVAYARLGRNDLAFRFFKKANASDPDNPVYAGNLVRLVDSPSFALNQMDRAPVAPAPRAEERPVVASAAAPAPRVRGKLYREGRGQFALVTQPEPDARLPEQRNAGLAACTTRTKAGKVRRCAEPALPQVGARSAATRKAAAPAVALIVAPPAADPGASAAPRASKRKVIDIAPPPVSKPASAQLVRKNAAL